MSFKPTFSLSSFTFIKRLFSTSSLSAISGISYYMIMYINFFCKLQALSFLVLDYLTLFISWSSVVCAQLCLTLGNPMDYSHPGSFSMGFPRQDYWIGLPFPSSGESSQPRDWTQVSSFADRFFTTEAPWKP